MRHAVVEAGRKALRLAGRIAVAGVRASSLRASRSLVDTGGSGGGELGSAGGGRSAVSWLKRGGLYIAGAAAVLRPLVLRDGPAAAAASTVRNSVGHGGR